MANQYKNTSQRPIGDWKPGEEFEAEFTADEERHLLTSGRIELVPRPYKVVGDNTMSFVPGQEVKPGEHFEAAFPAELETVLIDGGNIERSPRRADLKVKGKE